LVRRSEICFLVSYVYRSVKRRRLEIALGILWLVDGLLQFQPFMFTREFFAGTFGMANMGLPWPFHSADRSLTSMVITHPAVWNGAFASIQVLLGISLLFKRSAPLGLVASIPWALAVWALGEGFGGLFMNGSSLLLGAPGPAVLYAVIAALLWPGLPRVARDVVGMGAWVLAWSGSALLELEAFNHTAGVPGAQIANGRFGEPISLAWLDNTIGHLVGRGGVAFAVVLGGAAFLVGIGIAWPATRRVALVAGIVVAAAIGIVGQNLGAIATGHGTDPGSGPLFVLLAVALWPSGARTARGPKPESTVRTDDAVGGLPGPRSAPIGPSLVLASSDN
jgi:hypothetical protein